MLRRAENALQFGTKCGGIAPMMARLLVAKEMRMTDLSMFGFADEVRRSVAEAQEVPAE